MQSVMVVPLGGDEGEIGHTLKPIAPIIPGTIYGQVLSVRAICKVLQPYRLCETISNFKYLILKFQIRPSNCNELGIVSRYHGNEWKHYFSYPIMLFAVKASLSKVRACQP